MAFNQAQIAATGSTPVPLVVKGDGTAGTFKNTQGTVQTPLPIEFMITTGTVYWGGPGVSSSNGFLMVANSPITVNSISDDLPYVWSAGNVTVYVVVGQQ